MVFLGITRVGDGPALRGCVHASADIVGDAKQFVLFVTERRSGFGIGRGDCVPGGAETGSRRVVIGCAGDVAAGVAGVGAGVWVSRRIQRKTRLAESAHESDGVAGGGVLGASVAVHCAVGLCRLPADKRDAGGGVTESRRVAMADVAQDYDSAGDGESGGRHDPDIQLRDAGSERQFDSGDAGEVLPGHEDDLRAGG